MQWLKKGLVHAMRSNGPLPSLDINGNQYLVWLLNCQPDITLISNKWNWAITLFLYNIIVEHVLSIWSYIWVHVPLLIVAVYIVAEWWTSPISSSVAWFLPCCCIIQYIVSICWLLSLDPIPFCVRRPLLNVAVYIVAEVMTWPYFKLPFDANLLYNLYCGRYSI